MGNFSIQQQIDNYVSLIKNEGSLTEGDIKELTSHLHDSFSDLRKNGMLSEEEAFLVACKRLGQEEVLANEYGKVNPAIITSKTWAYLFLGYNLFYVLPSLVFFGFAFMYLSIYNRFQDGVVSCVSVTIINILFVCSLVMLVKNKNRIVGLIENQLKSNVLRTIGFSFLPLLLRIIAWVTTSGNKSISYTLYFHQFHNNMVEFSFYIAALCIPFAGVCLIFTVNNPGRQTLRTLFEMPSAIFMLLYGVFISFAAAGTRAINIDRIAWSATLVGLVYLLGAYVIARYNKVNNFRCFIWFSIFGLTAETITGISADLDRGNTYFTVYYLIAIIAGIMLGRFLGMNTTTQGKINLETN